MSTANVLHGLPIVRSPVPHSPRHSAVRPPAAKMASKFTTEKYAAIKLDTSNLAGPVHPVDRNHKGSAYFY